MLIAGAGMAGLVCAARLRELGRDVRVLEKGTRPGGSMLLSSCVVWRHLEWDDFRALDFDRARELLRQHLLVDLRNLYDRADIERLGFRYVAVGR